MADFTIARFHVITGDGFGATEMRIRRLSLAAARPHFRGSACWNSPASLIGLSPLERTTPRTWIPVILVVFGFVLARDRPMCIDVGAVLNLLFRQRDVQAFGGPVHSNYGEWREQH